MMTENYKSSGLLILGMHRSGTSAVTGLLHHLGLFLGSNLLSAADDNPKGFFEHAELVDVHDELLHAMGSSWDDPLDLPEGWERDPKIRPIRNRITDIIRRDFSNEPAWGIKDPRMCRLLPLWCSILNELRIEAKVVIVVRSPAEIAASLAKRESMSTDQAVTLWLSHYIAAERESRIMRRDIVFYQDLLADWSKEIARLHGSLSMDLFAFSESIMDKAEAFLSSELRHHHSLSLPTMRAPQNQWAQKIYDAFTAWRQNALEPRTAIDEARAALLQARTMSTPIISYFNKRQQTETEKRKHFQEFYEHELRVNADLNQQIEVLTSTFGKKIEDLTISSNSQIENLTAEVRRQIELAANIQARSAAVDEEHRANIEQFNAEILQERNRAQAEARRALSMEQARVAAAQEAAILKRHLAHAQTLLVDHDQVRSSLNDTKLQLALTTSELAMITSSTSWRITSPLRKIGRKMPLRLRRLLRGLAKIIYWTGTFQLTSKLRNRRRILAEVSRVSAVPNAASPTIDAGPTLSDTAALGQTPVEKPAMSTTEVLTRRFDSLDALRTYPEIHSGKRLSIVTDGISTGLLYGGVATAVLLGALIAQRIRADLRIITRATEADPSIIGSQLAEMGVKWEQDIDCIFSPPLHGTDIPVFEGDRFLTTSWWTTQAALRSISANKILYLLQEDERMFYPHGDDRLRCAEILGNSDIAFAINSGLLFEHFKFGPDCLPNIARKGVYFEPAFPEAHYYDDAVARHSRTKRNFLFYARPHNLRNLYWRGLEAINAAIESGILSPDEWNITFVGRDLNPVTLSRGIRPRILENLSWSNYAKLIRDTDMGLMMIDTPHPSYPPLDLAASGGVAVTNTCGIKQSLTNYSENIICVDSTVRLLCQGISEAAKLVVDEDRRLRNFQRNGLQRDWLEALEPAVQHAITHLVGGN